MFCSVVFVFVFVFVFLKKGRLVVFFTVLCPHADGLFEAEDVRTFRFHADVRLLIHSCCRAIILLFKKVCRT